MCGQGDEGSGYGDDDRSDKGQIEGTHTVTQGLQQCLRRAAEAGVEDAHQGEKDVQRNGSDSHHDRVEGPQGEAVDGDEGQAGCRQVVF